MAVELVVKELFAHPETGRRYPVGELISDPAEMAWAQQHFRQHVMRKYVADPSVQQPRAPAMAGHEPGAEHAEDRHPE